MQGACNIQLISVCHQQLPQYFQRCCTWASWLGHCNCVSVRGSLILKHSNHCFRIGENFICIIPLQHFVIKQSGGLQVSWVCMFLGFLYVSVHQRCWGEHTDLNLHTCNPKSINKPNIHVPKNPCTNQGLPNADGSWIKNPFVGRGSCWTTMLQSTTTMLVFAGSKSRRRLFLRIWISCC